MIAASDVAASVTSDSVMPPTPECSTRAATSSVPSASSAWVIASTEPCTSPLMTSGKSFWPLAWSWFIISASEPRAPVSRACAFSRFWRAR